MSTAAPHREGPRAHVIEQLCYACRVNMKDVVSHSQPPVETWRPPRGSMPHSPPAHGCSLLQPCLDLLPPYILAEAQLRSQRPPAEVQEFLVENSDDEAPASESGARGPPEQEGKEARAACDCINKNIFN